MNYMEQDYQKKQIEANQKFLLGLLNFNIGNYYPLRKWLGISIGNKKIDEISHLSWAYDTHYFKKGKKWYKQQTRTYQQPDLGMKLNLVLDKIPQLAIPALLQPAYGLGALALFFLTQTTYQPSSKDAVMNSAKPTTIYDDWIGLKDQASNLRWRTVLEFDISDIPANATFTQGDLLLYYYTYYESATNPQGKTAWAYKLSRTDWVENQTCWNNYKTGSAWTSAGGDYVTSNPSGGSTTFPSSYGWMTWDIQDIVGDAYDNSNDVELLMRFANEAVGDTYYSAANWYSSEYTTDTSLRPKLTVTYTVPVKDNSIFFSCNF